LAKGPALKKERVAKDRALRKAKLDAARRAYEALWAEHDYRGSHAGFRPPSVRDWHADQEGLHRWSRRWLEAQTALSEGKADQVAAYRAHLHRMETMQAGTKRVFKDRPDGGLCLAAAQFFCSEAELLLRQATE
jgi:hypothetical protein